MEQRQKLYFVVFQFALLSLLHSYGMFASVSGVLKEEMAPHLQPIITRMIESLTSQEGVTVSPSYSNYCMPVIVLLLYCRRTLMPYWQFSSAYFPPLMLVLPKSTRI